ncbi:MFS transporter [Limibaculum sp. FT325]|uniref:MFS transporter n=1 Tax=Thermohalobaculum sediminis TaxID=2939436 RepID=UPI0020C00C72|nr:MFS transporter [Limibaculum sediminis]MCL5776547.1 MFS transporter [Limibaculum sediminis]
MAETGLARADLARSGVMAAALAFGGLPLYVHAPRFYAEEMGLGLGALGAILLAARAVDSVQDPILGWLADRTHARRQVWALGAAAMLAAGFVILFSPPGWGSPALRLGLGLLAAFTGFSALQIALYDHGLALARAAGGGHTRVALWREAGGLIGVCLAAMAPALLGAAFGPAAGFLGFALLFVAVAAIASAAMAGRWRASGNAGAAGGFRQALAAPGVAPMLAFGFVNALPTAVTSTLFLFFVADVLEAEDHAGPMLLLFFAAAAAAAPFWARLAGWLGRRATLGLAMSLSIAAFAWAWVLGPGDVAPFYAVAIASGAALGADMTLAPAMLAARIEGEGGRVFALWTFLQKSALALAAGVALPLLALSGFEPGAVDAEGRAALSVAYALVPCILKIGAIAMLAVLPVEKETALANA